MFIPLLNEDEAFYISGLLNSSLMRLIVGSYTIETAMNTHIMKHLKVPKFDKMNNLHLDISSLSTHAHSSSNKLRDIEEQLDQKIVQLYGLTQKEINDVKESLKLITIIAEDNEDPHIISKIPKE